MLVRVFHTFAAAVVRIAEGLCSDSLQGIRNDRVTVVLGSYIGPAGGQIPHGLVAAPVAVFQLDGIPAEREGSQLMPQADAEDGPAADDLFQLFDAVCVSFGSPGPLDSIMPSAPDSRMVSAAVEAGQTVTEQPRFCRLRMMLCLAP